MLSIFNASYEKIVALTYLTIEVTLLDFATDTGSNHTGVPYSAATEGKITRKDNK